MENISKKESELRAARFFRNNYRDRGMLKWQGFYLSDHTSALSKEQRQKSPILRLEMNPMEIGKSLLDAWKHNAKVSLQLNQVNNNAVPIELHGYIKGYQEDKICISIKGTVQLISIDSIRNICEY